MFKLVSLALVALAAASAVNAAAILPRDAPPKGWIAGILEPYDNYHNRYIAIGCRNKHNTRFFDDCCHPLKKGETLEKNRKAYCRPGAGPAPSSTPATQPPANTLATKPTSSPAPKPTSVPDKGDDEGDDDDDEDCEEEPESSPAPAPVPTTSNIPKPNPSPTPSPAKPSPVKPSSTEDPKPSPTPVDNPSSDVHTGGHATWFKQNGVAGACGNTNPDSAFLVALDSRTYGNTSAKSKFCGRKVKINHGGKSVVATVEDACPTCDDKNSLDLSLAAFQALAGLDVGLLDITWQFI